MLSNAGHIAHAIPTNRTTHTIHTIVVVQVFCLTGCDKVVIVVVILGIISLVPENSVSDCSRSSPQLLEGDTRVI